MLRISCSLLILFLFNISCSKQPELKRDYTLLKVGKEKIKMLNDSSFLALKTIPNDSLYIINLWAKRSQKSLQNRQELNNFNESEFQLIQINLDYESALPKLVDSFQLNDFYYKPSNHSIIDSSWDGFLPATFYITKDTIVFEKNTGLNHNTIQEKINLLID